MLSYNPPRIGIVGCGNWSTSMHLPAMQRLQGKGLVRYEAVCDLNRNLAENYAAELKVKRVFTHMEEMIEQCDLDGLDLITTPEIKRTPLEIAIESQIPFLVEKPPTLTSAVHKRHLENIGDLPHVVGYNRRHSPLLVQARDWIKNETLQAAFVSFSRFQRWDQDFTTTAVHPIDTIRYLVGKDFTKLNIEAVPSGKACNYFINGWAGSTRIDIQITPDISLSEEKYILKGTDRTVIVSFPQPSCYDRIGYVELYESNIRRDFKTGDDFSEEGFTPAQRLSAICGIEREHEIFYKVLAGKGKPWSTLHNTLQTQEIREILKELQKKAPDCKEYIL